MTTLDGGGASAIFDDVLDGGGAAPTAPSEFMELFGEWGRDTSGAALVLVVETCLGTGGNGEIWAEPVTVEGLPVLYGSTVVRDSDGNERTSTASVYAELGETADRFTLNSRVTLPDGRVASVLAVAAPDVYGLFGFRVVSLT